VSVAFRRESDEEHREPRFELPLPPGPNLVTRNGLAQILARVRQLEEQIASGSDESAREAAKRALRYWRTRQSTAQIAPDPAGDRVAFGTRVSIRLNEAERTLCIVGDDEADPDRGFISFSAPLARALLGADVGDRLAFAGREAAIEILDIEPLPQA
jgi:transcription elongation GreA/GreB family factor